MRRWWLTIISIVVAFVVIFVGVISKGGFNQAVFGADNNAIQPVLIAQNYSPTRIMPLGDSITGGQPPQNSYRRLLWFYLLNAAYNVDFVGSTQLNCGFPAPMPDFDLDNEGHCGWRSDQILANIDGWLSSNRPDVVLIHLGTNDLGRLDDFGHERTAEDAIESLRGIIQKLQNYNPTVKILLAQIIPSCGNEERSIPFNSLIPNLANQTSTYQSPVIVVDQYTGFDPQLGADTFDGCHPNDTGEWKMATRWLEALKNVL
ncbi:MAG: SGNH/GDSL hydrolase family protein [Rhizonema sp. NSF051]|nr:SGNH/GDSL hydrolase family protein [Rhizonema sp. NSF051]